MNAKQLLEMQRRDSAQEAQRRDARAALLRTLEATQNPAGELREEGIPLYAHCANVVGGCDDAQEEVTGARVTVAHTYRMNGGDATGPMADLIERSSEEFDFLSDEHKFCKRCGNIRAITNQKRPVYAPLSGHDPRELIKLAQGWVRSGLRPEMANGAVFQKAQAADSAANRSPLDRLQTRYVDGEIDEAEYQRKRAILNGDVVVKPDPDADITDLPKGVRQRGKSYQAYARVNGEQRQETFPTVEGAEAQYAEWTAERSAS
jgi:hypothetical protein